MCAYVRAQVEVVMAGWMTEETRALYIYMCVRTYVHKLKLLWLAGRLRRQGPYTYIYVRAQVEVAMAGWMTEETRALLGL